MDKQVYRIDAEGHIIEKMIKDFDEDGNCTEELAEDIITVDPPQGLYGHKWTGAEWIEIMTEEEYIATLPEQPEREPTETEQLQQELANTNAMLLEFMETMLM